MWILLYTILTPTSSQTSTSMKWTGWFPWTIKVWHLVALDMAPMFIAKEQWFFADEWLDVETIFFSNPWDNNAALIWGDLQFHINPFTLPFLWQHQWADMRIVSSAGWSEIIEVVIQWAYEVETIQELKTRVDDNPWKKLKIWTLKWDTLDMIIYRSFLEQGLTYDNFEMVRFNDLLAMVQSFKSNDIDILSHIQPYTTDLKLNYNATSLTNNEAVRGIWTPNTTTVIMESFGKQYPETVQAYLRAQKKWLDFMITNPEIATNLLIQWNYYKVDHDVLLTALRNQRKNIALTPYTPWIQKAINDMVTQGYMAPIDLDVIDTNFLEILWIK